MYMAVDNFAAFEATYMESEYHIPAIEEGFNDPWTSRLVRNVLKFPIIALCILISGLAIAQFKPRTTRLAGWNVFTSIVVASVFIGFTFISCPKDKLTGESKNEVLIKDCSRTCNCDTSAKFDPVCTVNGQYTYYNPCQAGCSQIKYANDVR